jgi:flavin-dependent dehydrogenase
MHDVAIVGGGLAGAATAIHLAQLGLRVVVLERNTGPRRKPCGEGLFRRGVKELQRLGVLDDLRHCSSDLAGVRFHAGPHTATAEPHWGAGIGVRREALDAAVLARAEAAGAEIRRGVTARGLLRQGRRVAGVATSHGDVPAKVVVAADGLNSRIRRLAGLEGSSRGARYGISAHVRLAAPPGHFVEVYFEDGFELYLTPVGASDANVALLLRKPAMQRFAGRLAEEYEATLRAHPALAAGFELLDEPLAAGPFAANATRSWRANLVLVGDAAGFFDGITGEGMSVALVSARQCAAAVCSYLETGEYDGFRTFERSRRSLVRNSNLLGRVSLALGARPPLARWSVRNLERRPATFEKLVGISAGEHRLRDLRPRDFLALATGL